MTAYIHDTLQHEIESAREKFQHFLVIIPEHALHCSSKDIQWTNAEILYKISISPLVIYSVLRRNFGPWTQRVLPIPGTGSLFPKWEEKSVCSHASRMSLMNFAQEYQNNCNQVLKILDELHEEDFTKTVTGVETDPTSTGRIRVEELFHYVKDYYDQYRPMVDLDS
jgi:hypothetical protein